MNRTPVRIRITPTSTCVVFTCISRPSCLKTGYPNASRLFDLDPQPGGPVLAPALCRRSTPPRRQSVGERVALLRLRVRNFHWHLFCFPFRDLRGQNGPSTRSRRFNIPVETCRPLIKGVKFTGCLYNTSYITCIYKMSIEGCAGLNKAW